jgi:alginate O-acetyltransferase complex protein AlgI
MSITSLSFLIFFVVFFALNWSVKSVKWQNVLLLAGSYLFYVLISWKMLLLLVALSGFSFYVALKLDDAQSEKGKKRWLMAGLFVTVGVLAFFKYFNFFIVSINDFLALLHLSPHIHTLNILVPVGVSYYTFKIVSYFLDIYKGRIPATKNVVAFFSFVAFFPTILAGPIDKARAFIFQLEKSRTFQYKQAVDGLRQIFWGLFKKMVIANNCAVFANQAFADYHTLSSSTLMIGLFFYAFQLYADFSGYSDMAIGIGKLLGFSVTKNFDYPFFAQNVAVYWRKWHISLTSWLTEYVFTPLSISFRDYGKTGLILAIVINFTLVGLWHGANWTYVWFGVVHGIAFIPLILRGSINKKRKIAKGKLFPSPKEIKNIVLTFSFVLMTFVLFRSDTISDAVMFYRRLFTETLFSVPHFVPSGKAVTTLVFILFLMTVEWFGREGEYAVAGINKALPRYVQWAFYYSLLLAMLLFSAAEEQFIYVQF